jgi:hypothetical protein
MAPTTCRNMMRHWTMVKLSRLSGDSSLRCRVEVLAIGIDHRNASHECAATIPTLSVKIGERAFRPLRVSHARRPPRGVGTTWTGQRTTWLGRELRNSDCYPMAQCAA